MLLEPGASHSIELSRVPQDQTVGHAVSIQELGEERWLTAHNQGGDVYECNDGPLGCTTLPRLTSPLAWLTRR